MSAPWTLKSKVLDELQLAQRRITSAGCCISELLTEYAAEGNRTSESEYSRLWMINTVLTVQLGRCATATNLLLSFDLPPRIVDQLRTEWGKLADLLAGDMTMKAAEAIDRQMDRIQELTCQSATSFCAGRPITEMWTMTWSVPRTKVKSAEARAEQFLSRSKAAAQRNRN